MKENDRKQVGKKERERTESIHLALAYLSLL